jgi:ribosomal protein S18 acetylase RimI-like enzyme
MISVEFITPSPSNWETLGDQIYKIERSIFGEESLDQEMMRSDINDSKTNLILLKDGSSIVGFTYTVPENEDSARIVDTVLMKKYQHKGFVSILMSCLETELRKSGYKYITRDVLIKNGYADKIMKNYNSQIIETKELTSKWGKQRYFKIQL